MDILRRPEYRYSGGRKQLATKAARKSAPLGFQKEDFNEEEDPGKEKEAEPAEADAQPEQVDVNTNENTHDEEKESEDVEGDDSQTRGEEEEDALPSYARAIMTAVKDAKDANITFAIGGPFPSSLPGLTVQGTWQACCAC